jgi:hypothetical protein
MHPFSLSRADDPAQAIAAHAQDPGLAFIAGGTDLIGLMKDRARRFPSGCWTSTVCPVWRGSKRCRMAGCASGRWPG